MSTAPGIVTTAKIVVTIRCALGLAVNGLLFLDAQDHGDEVGSAASGLALAAAIALLVTLVGLWRDAEWGRVVAASVEAVVLAGGLFFVLKFNVVDAIFVPGIAITIVVLVLLSRSDVKDWYQYRD